MFPSVIGDKYVCWGLFSFGFSFSENLKWTNLAFCHEVQKDIFHWFGFQCKFLFPPTPPERAIILISYEICKMVMGLWHLLKEFRMLRCRPSLWNLVHLLFFFCGVATISLWPKKRLRVVFWWKRWTGGLTTTAKEVGWLAENQSAVLIFIIPNSASQNVSNTSEGQRICPLAFPPLTSQMRSEDNILLPYRVLR